MADDKRWDRVEEKLDRLDARMAEMNVTLVKQHLALEEHIRRTNIPEEKVVPLHEMSAQTKFVLKILAALVAVGGTGFGLKELVAIIAKAMV